MFFNIYFLEETKTEEHPVMIKTQSADTHPLYFSEHFLRRKSHPCGLTSFQRSELFSHLPNFLRFIFHPCGLTFQTPRTSPLGYPSFVFGIGQKK